MKKFPLKYELELPEMVARLMDEKITEMLWGAAGNQ